MCHHPQLPVHRVRQQGNLSAALGFGWVCCGSFSALTMELLIPCVKIFCHPLTCQGWGTAGTGAAEVGMQKGTQPEERTRKKNSGTACPNLCGDLCSHHLHQQHPLCLFLALRGPKDPKCPKLSGRKFPVDFDNGLWSRSLVMSALDPSHCGSVRALIWP